MTLRFVLRPAPHGGRARLGLRFAAFVVACRTVASLGAGLPTVASAADPYSPGGWSTLHQGPDNRKLVAAAPLDGPHRTWTALAGASVLTAPTLSPDGRTLYVTTGKARGHANLHAFDLDGRVRWQSAPWQDPEQGVDPCAILSSPIVDRDGDVYVGDCNQLHAFHADGRVKWVAPLPKRRDGDWRPSKKLPINAFTTAVFTPAGHVLGVTNFGDVAVYDRATGKRLNREQRLPGRLPPPAAMKLGRSTLGAGLVDPEIRAWAWELLMGGRMQSANTPAIDLSTGRVFVAASSRNPGKGALYALDLVERSLASGTGEWYDGVTSDFERDEVEIKLAFATDMGPGSGSSPALSPERDRVYVSDETGLFYGIDAKTGTIRFQVRTKATAAAAAVAANGDVLALQGEGEALVCIMRRGRIRWQSDLTELTRAALPEIRFLGAPVALANGNPTVVGDVVLVPVAYGYASALGRRIPWPVRSFIVAVDLATGEGLRNVVELADDSTGITAVLPDGTILSSLGAVITSSVDPLSGIARTLLPGDLELLGAVGGLQVSRPAAAP